MLRHQDQRLHKACIAQVSQRRYLQQTCCFRLIACTYLHFGSVMHGATSTMHLQFAETANIASRPSFN